MFIWKNSVCICRDLCLLTNDVAPEFTPFCRDTMTLARQKYWQIRTNFTAPLHYNHILKSYPNDYK